MYFYKGLRETFFLSNDKYDNIKRRIAGIISVIMFLIPPLVISILPQNRLSYHNIFSLFGGIIFFIGLAINITARRKIGFIPGLKIKDQLISTGIYGVIRHPIYLANSLLVIGWSLLFAGTISLIFSFVYLLSYIPLIYFEERILLDEYGNEYIDYRKKTPYAIIPRLF
jgi:protein-S-isoprenylcysteine O-methyltransferase Ste14